MRKKYIPIYRLIIYVRTLLIIKYFLFNDVIFDNAIITISLFQSKPYFNSSTGPRHTKHIKW